MNSVLPAGRRSRSAFTLVELMIVVSILGILAAIVIPRFSSATDTARYSSLKNSIKIVRSQLSIYQTQHNGQWPDLISADGWDLMTQKTNTDHTFTGTPPLGPYLQKVPINSFTGGSIVTNDETSAQDWLYDRTTGEFKAFMSSADYDKLSSEDSDIVSFIVTP